MRMGQGVRTGLGHGGITCILQTQFSSFFFWRAVCVCVWGGGGGVECSPELHCHQNPHGCIGLSNILFIC